MLRGLRNLWRLAGIGYRLARHDALAFLVERLPISPAIPRLVRLVSRRDAPGRPGQRLAAALQELGPSFIKLGQTLATRADLLGDEVAADLSELQDRLPPFPFEQARRTIEAEFGVPLEALYADFDPKPVAAASIAQVHFAVTPAGDEVAVRSCGRGSRWRSSATSTCSPGSRAGSRARGRACAACGRRR